MVSGRLKQGSLRWRGTSLSLQYDRAGQLVVCTTACLYIALVSLGGFFESSSTLKKWRALFLASLSSTADVIQA